MRKALNKKQLIERLSEGISKEMAKAVLLDTKKRLEDQLREEFDMDDFFFSDAENAAMADMEDHYGDKMVKTKLGDKEDTKSFIKGLGSASEEDVDKHASHLKDKYSTFNQKLVNAVSKLPKMADMKERDPRGLLDIIGLAAYKYLVNNRVSSPFVLELQGWLADLDHEFSPTPEDLKSVDVNVYNKLDNFGNIYNKKAEMQKLNEALKALLEVKEDRYYQIVYLQGDEAEEPLRILDEEGEDAAMQYMMQWYEGYVDGESMRQSPHGTQDHAYSIEMDGKTFSIHYNLHIPYIGLSVKEEVDVVSTDPHEYDDLYDGTVNEGGERQVFTYNINLDERGHFYADVRDPNDKTVFDFKVGYGEDEDNNLFSDGYMKNKYDLEGLEEYLKSLHVMGSHDKLISPYSHGHRLEEDIDDMDIDGGELSDIDFDPYGMDVDSEERSYSIEPPVEGDPLWYIVDQTGDPVEGFATEELAQAALQKISKPQLQYGKDFKESRLDRIDALLNETLELLKEYDGYDGRSDSDRSAPWNIEDNKPEKKSPPATFKLTDSNDECMILDRDGISYAFNLYSLSQEDIENIAIDYVGVPSRVEKADGDYHTIHDTSQYGSVKDLPASAILDSINANYSFMSVGEGLSDWEDGAHELVKIDRPLAQSLKRDYPRLSVPIS